MLLKLFLVALLVTQFVNCQSTSSCDSTWFTFYNGFDQGGSFSEHEWDWEGSYFGDGTSDTFDDYLYMTILMDNLTYSMEDYYNNPMEYVCDIGTTDWNSTSFASYTYNISDTILVHREFYAPRSVSWIRVVDSIRNIGSAAINISIVYNGNYGSDDDTIFHESNDYFWVSSDGDQGDAPFSVNAASPGARVVPIKMVNFIQGVDDTTYKYQDIIIPAGESRSVMVVLAQHNNVSDALAVARDINGLPMELLTNLTALDDIVNWGICTNSFAIVNPQEVYCSAPALITFDTSRDESVTFNDNDMTASNNQLSVPIVNGNNVLSYRRPVGDCSVQTINFNFVVTDANLTLSVDTSRDLPAVTASGGFGEYKYSWSFSSGGNLVEFSRSTATVTVTDREGCTASADIDLSKNSTPSVSSAARLIGSVLLGTVAVVVLV